MYPVGAFLINLPTLPIRRYRCTSSSDGVSFPLQPGLPTVMVVGTSINDTANLSFGMAFIWPIVSLFNSKGPPSIGTKAVRPSISTFTPSMRDKVRPRAEPAFSIFISLSVSHWQIYKNKLIRQHLLDIFLSNYFADSNILPIFAIGVRRTRSSRRSVMLPTCETKT